MTQPCLTCLGWSFSQKKKGQTPTKCWLSLNCVLHHAQRGLVFVLEWYSIRRLAVLTQKTFNGRPILRSAFRGQIRTGRIFISCQSRSPQLRPFRV
jgi:hypothetical protein